MQEYEVGLKLRADGQGLTGQLRLTKEEVRQLNNQLDQTERSGRRAGSGLDAYGRHTSRASRGTRALRTETSSLTRQFGSLRSMLATVGLVALTRDLLTTTAEIQNIDTRIRGLSGSAAQYADHQRFIVDTARDLRREIVTLSDNYARLLSLQKANIVTGRETREIFAGMIDVQAETGASTVQLSQAMFGMQQGFAQNILRAEELSQIVEPLPGFLAELERAAGLSAGGFREMVNAGEVTSEFLKETFIQALEAYEGAAKRTADNLTQLWTGLSNEYSLLARELQQPITDTLAPLVESAESLLQQTVDNLPIVIDSLSTITELVMVGGALYIGLKALPVLVGTFSSILGAASFNAAAFVLGVRAGVTPLEMMNIQLWGGASAASMFSSKMALATASLQGLAAFYAGFQIGEFLNNFSVVRTAALAFVGTILTQFERLKFAGKATWLSFENAFDKATSGIKTGYAELLEFIGNGLDLVGADQLAKTYTDYAANLRTGADADANYKSGLEELAAERDLAIAGINEHITALVALELSGVNTHKSNDALADSIGALADESKAAVTPVVTLTEAQEELLKELLPLHAAQLEYEDSLKTLNAIIPQTAEEARLKADAISALNDEYNRIMQPTQAFLDNLENEVSWLEQENAAIRSGNVHRLAEIELRRQGVDATDEQIASLADLMARQEAAQQINSQLTDQANPFTEMWLESIRRVDGAWFDFVRSGFDNMKSLKDNVIGLAKDMAAELVVIFSRQKLLGGLAGFGGLAFAGSASAASAATGAAGVGGTDVMAMLAASPGISALIGGAANLSFMAANGLNAIGLEGLGNLAANQGVKIATDASAFGSIKDIGLSALGGIAGNFAGDALGGALFNKQANSNIGSSIGGTAGGIVGGPVGAFIGATLGALVDTAFGGDGMKRFSLGIGAGGDPVRDKHISGRSVFDSGLEVSHVTRRVESELLEPMLDTFKAIDSTFSQVTRAAGKEIDFSKLVLDGMNADAGSNAGGSLFGLRGENGLPENAEELIQEQFREFTKQLVANVPGLNGEIVEIISAATGDAEEILAQYESLLSLDSIFSSGSQLFTDIETFRGTFEFFAETLQREGEALSAAASRVGQSMLLLQRIGLGDGSSASAEFANQVEGELGLDQLQQLVSAYSAIYLSEAESLSASIDILTDQVNSQFQELDLSLSDFTTLDSFRNHFESVKESLDAVDLSKYLVAAVNLGELIDLREQEAIAIRNSSDAMQQSISTLETSISSIATLMDQAATLSVSVQQDIFRLKNATPLHPVLGVGTTDERLSAVLELKRLYEEQHSEQVSAITELHNKEMAHYEQRMQAQVSLDKFIRELAFGDSAPVTASERLRLSSQEFNRLVEEAMQTGNASDVTAAQEAARSRIGIARTMFASGQQFEDIFYDTTNALEELSSILGSGTIPGPLDTSAADAELITQLETLQQELGDIQLRGALDIASQFETLNVSVGDLSTAVVEQLSSIVSLLANFGSGGGVTPSGGNPNNIADADIASFIASQPLNDVGAANVIRQAIQHGLTAEDLARAGQSLYPGITAGEIRGIAHRVGFKSFFNGTDRITEDGLNFNHKEEIVFSPPEANSLRRKVIESVGGNSGDPRLLSGIRQAITEQSAMIEKLTQLAAETKGKQHEEMTTLIAELQQELETVRRELEERAA